MGARDGAEGTGRGGPWFAIGVVPALVGWGAMALPATAALAVLAVAFAAAGGLDRAAVAAGLAPAWYGRLRTALSAVVAFLLAAACVVVWARAA